MRNSKNTTEISPREQSPNNEGSYLKGNKFTGTKNTNSKAKLRNSKEVALQASEHIADMALHTSMSEKNNLDLKEVIDLPANGSIHQSKENFNFPIG